MKSKVENGFIPFYRKLPKSQGTYLTREMLESLAFWELTGSSIKVLLIFRLKIIVPGKSEAKHMKGKRHELIVNNGKIVFTYREAGRYGIPKSTFERCINKLILTGFIDIAEPSGDHKPTKYSISDRWKKYGTPEFESVVKQKLINQRIGCSTRFEKKSISVESLPLLLEKYSQLLSLKPPKINREIWNDFIVPARIISDNKSLNIYIENPNGLKQIYRDAIQKILGKKIVVTGNPI